MRCPSCQNENDAGAAYCDMCGMDLAPASPAPGPVSAPAPQPPQPVNPHQKRRTVFEPDPAAPPPPPAHRGADFFANPPPPRPTFDPRDPFAAASIPPTRLSAPAPAPAAMPPAPPQPAQPAPPPAAAAPRPKARTIVDMGSESPAAAGLVRGALFEYRGPTDPGRVHPLRAGRNVLGRNADCDVVLDDGRVSGQHAFLFIRAEDASFIDVSSNGSIVNGAVVHGEQIVLQNQSVITLGGTTLVLVIVPEQLLSRRSQ
ncbi:MAG TPA: FHA domain-containing protein [Archangium sp.]|uniref:FHA domain-containing protein n=1 Tax=Archangium sp. TaxID=1872627 RepID=UPI002E368D0B|nr:FHA domain-containing protein [Archangium sp.]HEX5747639.1 FHA domain-containing protein [Archangium sp.]